MSILTRIEKLEQSINPKTTLFQFYAINKAREKILINQYPIKRFKNQDVMRWIIGYGIIREEDIQKGWDKYKEKISSDSTQLKFQTKNLGKNGER